MGNGGENVSEHNAKKKERKDFHRCRTRLLLRKNVMLSLPEHLSHKSKPIE